MTGPSPTGNRPAPVHCACAAAAWLLTEAMSAGLWLRGTTTVRQLLLVFENSSVAVMRMR
jgi:hypothetical protein